MDLTDEQWRVLEPLFSEPAKRADGRGRPWRGTREVINGVLWVLRTGAPWRDLPKRYPSYLPPPLSRVGARRHVGARARGPLRGPAGARRT